jgi:hypothetical protein
MDESPDGQLRERHGEEKEDCSCISTLLAISSTNIYSHCVLTFKTACNCALFSELDGLPKPLDACSDTAIDCALPNIWCT